ncbi:transmembrane protein [Ceratobasidium sp. AG-Ba]|nr:transmembrane protein [Ceratobasidium sp. AG-Ba]QRW14130.1 transmembrane protein [Ceratobasidium sp. AG-Ba]
MSGTASTLVELIGFDEIAFDPAPVLDARARRLRVALTPQVLWDRINQKHLSSVMALHCLNFLVKNCVALSGLYEYVNTQFRTTFAIHRMPDGHQTKAHPLSSSNINEGSAEGCRAVLEDILLRQLNLSRKAIEASLTLVGGNLGSIEKVRALISLSSSCPHGYSAFKWVIPLVQLWHMGWADLSRILATFWGKSMSKDPSTLWHNSHQLHRNLKPQDRPEYYPTQQLVF